jgi:hypothetical protein
MQRARSWRPCVRLLRKLVVTQHALIGESGQTITDVAQAHRSPSPHSLGAQVGCCCAPRCATTMIATWREYGADGERTHKRFHSRAFCACAKSGTSIETNDSQDADHGRVSRLSATLECEADPTLTRATATSRVLRAKRVSILFTATTDPASPSGTARSVTTARAKRHGVFTPSLQPGSRWATTPIIRCATRGERR